MPRRSPAWRFLVAELPRLVARLAIAFVAYWAITVTPWPGDFSRWISIGAFALLATTVLVLSGKCLFDTLFYDRYWRQMDSR